MKTERMPRLQKDKVQLAFSEVSFFGNLTLHSALKIPISMRHFIVLGLFYIRSKVPCNKDTSYHL